MLKLVGLLLVLGVIVGAAFGSAAALDVDDGVIQAGRDASLDGDTDGVVIKWKTFLTGPPNPSEFYVCGVRVEDIDLDDGSVVLVSLSDINGQHMRILRGTVTGGVADCDEFFWSGAWVDGVTTGVPPCVRAEDVYDISVCLKNAWHPYDGP